MPSRSYLHLSLIFVIALFSSSVAIAQTVSTEFNTADGFVTGSGAPVTLAADDGSFTATFNGGIQQQSFDGPAYSSGPAALFFIDGNYTGSFGNPQAGSTQIGNVTFSSGVDLVSFFAADRANGTPTFSVFGVDGVTQLGTTTTITSTVNNDGTSLFTLSSDTLGAQIGRIDFDNAGPAANPPYVIAIDGFSASVAAVPEPATAGLFGLASLGMFCVRRRR